MTITLADYIKYRQYKLHDKVLASYNGTEEWFDIDFLIDTCQEQDIPFDDVILTY